VENTGSQRDQHEEKGKEVTDSRRRDNPIVLTRQPEIPVIC